MGIDDDKFARRKPIVITLALSKGRIFDETLPLLAAAGIAVLDRLLARCPVTGLHARGGC